MTTATRPSSTRDDSVMVALAELRSLETERVDREVRAQKDAAAAAAQRESERLAEERARAEEAARAEARERARMTLEAQAKAEAELERDRRIAAMRAELTTIQSERARFLAEISNRAITPPPRSRSYGLAFGLSSVVAAALAGMLVVQAQHTPMPVSVPASSGERVAPAGEIEPAPAVEVEVVTEARAEPAPVIEAPAADEARPARPHRDPVRRPERDGVRPPADAHHDLSLGLDFGDDEGLVPTGARRAH